MEILSAIVVEVGKCLWNPVKRNFYYLFRYKKNIEHLQNEVGQLEKRRLDIQKMVDEARERLEEPTHEVQGWFEEVHDAETDVKKLEDEATANNKCLNSWCPNLISRYRLGKEVTVKAALVKQIYERGDFQIVSRKRPSPSVEPVYVDYDVSLKSVEIAMEQVLNALRDENVRLIGVHGMGGVGKTTLMKRLNNELDKIKSFKKVIMVTVSKEVNLRRIQDNIAERLDNFKLEYEDGSIRANRLRHRLKMEKPVLIILDDVWSELEIGQIGIPFRDEHMGCKIILTTRLESVCLRMGIDRKIKLQVLSKEESWELFKLKTGNLADSTILRPIAEKIVELCGGLPLAIVASASCLKMQSNDIVWTDALTALKNPTPIEIGGILPEVIESLRFSYEHLKGEGIKLFFLLCCLFPEDSQIDASDLIHYGTGERLMKVDGSLGDATKRGNDLIDKLKDSSLLLECGVSRVMLHDIVRDVAITIASKEHGFLVRTGVEWNEWPKREELDGCKRISLMNNRITTLDNKPNCPHLLSLLLSGNKLLEKISDHFFEQMKALVVLDLSSTNIQHLPSSISSLKNLHTLCLNRCGQLKDISAVRGLDELEILSMKMSAVEELPKVLIGALNNLKHLDLSECYSLKRVAPKVISSLSRLEELDMDGSFADWEVGGNEDGSNANFSEVASLTRLTALTVHVKNKSSLFQDYLSSFRNLKTFKISLGRYGYYSPNASRSIWLSQAVISIPVPVMDLISVTGELWLKECQGLKSLLQLDESSNCITGSSSDNIKVNEDPLGVVENEALRNALGRSKLPHTRDTHVLQKMCNLEVLRLESCKELIDVFNTEGLARQWSDALLPRLTKLILQGLNSLTSIWKGGDIPIGSLNSLRHLSILSCHNLRYLFSPVLAQRLQNLDILQVSECSKLEKLISEEQDKVMTATDIPNPSAFNNLRVLFINNCQSLKYIFSSGIVHHLFNLETLSIGTCTELEEIICMNNGNNQMMVEKGVFPLLKTFEMINLGKLKSIYEGRVTFDWPLLEEMTVTSCPNLKRLPLKSQSAPKLKRFEGYSPNRWFDQLEWEDDDIKSRLQALQPKQKVHMERAVHGEISSAPERMEKPTSRNARRADKWGRKF